MWKRWNVPFNQKKIKKNEIFYTGNKYCKKLFFLKLILKTSEKYNHGAQNEVNARTVNAINSHSNQTHKLPSIYKTILQ